VSATWICDAYSTREKCTAEITDFPPPTTLEAFTNGCEGDPLADISAISKQGNVRWMMKAGQTVVDKTKRPAIN
jgi:hypothetical protein